MSEQTNGAAESTPDPRPALDAIAEDLVTSMPAPPEPETEAQQPTPEAPAEEATPEAEEPKVEAADPPEETGGDEDFIDFLDELTTGAAPQQDVPEEGDDAVVRVKLNGEMVDVTLGDLKRSYSGEQAIDVRVQEASEARNKAFEEAEQYVQQVRSMHDRLAHVYQHYNDMMFAPRVEEPSAELAQSDPFAFNQQLAAYNADQKRIGEEMQQMQGTLQQASQMFQQQREQTLAAEQKALYTKLPGIGKSAETKQAFRKRIADIGQAHGFTAEEIAGADDHRLLTLAAEASAYRELKARLTNKKPKANTKRRPMPTRGNNSQRTPQSRQQARQRKAIEKARATGSVDDVAASLII